MSYILDALRKAEAERERGQLPGLHSAAAMPRLPERRLLEQVAPGWPVLAGLGALAVAGGLGGWAWLQRGDAEPAVAALVTSTAAASRSVEPLPSATAVRVPAAPTGRVPTQTAAPTAQQAVSPSPANPPVAGAAAAPQNAKPMASTPPTPPTALTPPTAATAPAPGPKDSNRGAAELAVSAAAVTPAAPAAVAVTASAVAPTPAVAAVAPPADGRIHAVDELPAEVRRELPKLDFGGLVQLDNPPRRSLIVNGAILMEGELVQPNLVLEQIRLTGAVLRYKGWRFQLPL